MTGLILDHFEVFFLRCGITGSLHYMYSFSRRFAGCLQMQSWLFTQLSCCPLESFHRRPLHNLGLSSFRCDCMVMRGGDCLLKVLCLRLLWLLPLLLDSSPCCLSEPSPSCLGEWTRPSSLVTLHSASCLKVGRRNSPGGDQCQNERFIFELMHVLFI